MALQTRPITVQDLERARALHNGEIELPPWIAHWKAQIEEKTQLLAAAYSQGGLSEEEVQRYSRAIAGMMHRKDGLYLKWMDGLPHKTWDDLAKERPPSKDDLFRYTCEDTEDFLNPPGVSSFVLFLNQQWDGFLKDFAHACLRECDPLLEEAFILTPRVRRILSYPKQAFGTDNWDVMEARLTEWMQKNMPLDSPEYVQRLLAANALVALGNEFYALVQMEYARCEAAEPSFAKMMAQRDPRTTAYLTQTQHWQIDVLLKLWPS